MKPVVNFVLHAHLPWLKGAGKWPFGEEWLYQAMLDTYIPLLDMFERLRAAGIREAITLGITPVLIEMLVDPYFQTGFDAYLDARKELIESDILAFRGSERLRQLAKDAQLHVCDVQHRWNAVYQRDLVGAFADLALRGEIEVLTGAATHAYLPLLESRRAIERQLATGIATTERAFGMAPRGVWLPECGFDRILIPILERLGLRFFYADERAIGGIESRVDRPLHYPNSDVSYFVRHPLARGELLDTDLGYPGNPWYREFYKRHERSGIRYWRVTDREAGLEAKEAYEPARALEQVRLHATDFVRKINALQVAASEQAYFTFTFDAELFGHWWGEGILWLEETLVQLHHERVARFSSPSHFLDVLARQDSLELPRCSWGVGGDDRTWANERTDAYWHTVRDTRRQFEELARDCGRDARFVQQAARELLLLESSDWPFMIANRDADGFPDARIAVHADRFAQLCLAAKGENHDEAVVSSAMQNDTLFNHVVVEAPARAAERV